MNLHRLTVMMMTIGLAPAAARAAMLVEWTSPDSGFFHTGLNWSTGLPPGPADTAVIDVPGTIVVTHATGATLVASLDSREELHVIGASSLGVSQSATLRGSVVLDTSGGLYAQQPTSTIELVGPVTYDAGEIGGAGEVESFDVMTIAGVGSRSINAPLHVMPGARLDVSAVEPPVIGATLFNQGTVEVIAGATLLVQTPGTGIANAGTIRVAAGAMLDFTGNAGAAIDQTAGTIDLDGGAILTGGGTVTAQDGEFVGHGEVEGDVFFGSNLLADPRPSPACLLVTGDLMQLGGEIVIEFDEDVPGESCTGGGAADAAGPGVSIIHDLWSVSGNVTLAGSLTVRLAGTLVAPLGASFDVIKGASVSGPFGQTTVPMLAGSRTFDVTYTADAVRLVVIAHPCPGDLDGNGVVAVEDLLRILADWGEAPGEPSDTDASGAVDVTDLLLILGRWGACP